MTAPVLAKDRPPQGAAWSPARLFAWSDRLVQFLNTLRGDADTLRTDVGSLQALGIVATGVVSTDGAGGATLEYGSGVSSVAVSGADISVTLSSAMADLNYGVVVSEQRSDTNQHMYVVDKTSVTQFALDIEGTSGSTISAATTALEFAFVVFGARA